MKNASLPLFVAGSLALQAVCQVGMATWCGRANAQQINMARYSVPERGGAIRDRYGNVKCGVGNCATDELGQIKCSTTPGGGAAIDSYGKVKCLDGCADATQQLCEVGR
jgi:hypothetical protein